MKAVGFNFRENIPTEANPALNTCNANDVRKYWIKKTKALAKLKHLEGGRGCVSGRLVCCRLLAICLPGLLVLD